MQLELQEVDQVSIEKNFADNRKVRSPESKKRNWIRAGSGSWVEVGEKVSAALEAAGHTRSVTEEMRTKEINLRLQMSPVPSPTLHVYHF